MRCQWCHNPETISFQPEILYYPEKCLGCGHCAEGCFAGARVPCGAKITVGQVLEDVAPDRPYYGDTGGVTISGGEPLCQPDFSRALLAACREKAIHTAVETNLNAPVETAGLVLSNCDFIMCDLKIADGEKHKRFTGCSNGLILENIRRLPGCGVPFIVRTPVVPGVNDTPEDLKAVGTLIQGLEGLLYYELLPYHLLGLSKGKRENGFEPVQFQRPDKEKMLRPARGLKDLRCSLRVAGQRIS